MYAYLRHSRQARSTVLAICNLDPLYATQTHIHIPADAVAWAGKKQNKCVFRNLLEPESPCIECTVEELTTKGLNITLAAGHALLLEWI